MRRRPNLAATIWGLAFVAFATVVILRVAGFGISLANLGILASLVLIGLGVIALLINRKN